MSLRKAKAWSWAPDLRLEDRPGIQQLARQLALLGGALHGAQQRRQRRPIPGARILLQGPAQGQVLHPALVGHPMRVGGQKSKRIGRIALVLREVEGHAPDCLPGWIARFKPACGPARSLLNCRPSVRIQAVPEPAQDLAVEVLEALHRRRGLGQTAQLGCRRFGDAQRRWVFQVWIMAERGKELPGQAAPEIETRRQLLMQEFPAQQNQALGGRGPKGLLQARANRRAELRLSLVVRLDK